MINSNNGIINYLKAYTEKESDVLISLAQQPLQEITLKQNGEGKIYEILGVEKMYIHDLNKPFAYFITGNYQDLLFRINNNKNIYLERTTKHRL